MFISFKIVTNKKFCYFKYITSLRTKTTNITLDWHKINKIFIKRKYKIIYKANKNLLKENNHTFFVVNLNVYIRSYSIVKLCDLCILACMIDWFLLTVNLQQFIIYFPLFVVKYTLKKTDLLQKQNCFKPPHLVFYRKFASFFS